ncbi:hypothetical protein TrVFT333_008729 [Trichoderma virens FT-333]|nr:hypothetical protein TrVFT333_008729 [Trichoderma virens FT-333]
MAPEQYRTPPQRPPVFTATAESILADAKKSAEQSKSVLDQIVASVTPETATFDNTLKPILIDGNDSSGPQNILTFYQHVSTNESLREASTKAEELLNDFYIEAKMREDVFKLVDAAYATRASQNLDKESLHILEKERQKYIRNGLLLPAGEKRDRFKEIQKRLSQLCIQGKKNLNEEKGGVWFTPRSSRECPRMTLMSTHSKKEPAKTKERRRYVIAEANKVNNNVEIFSQIMDLRDEAARLLGYPNHASLRIEEKMAKSPARVNEFLGDLRTRLAPGGEKEVQKLLEYKKRDYEERGIPFDGNFYMWDTAYYSRIMKEKEYSVDEVAISQYYPAESTFAGMLKIFEEIFGFVFVELGPEDRARLSPSGKAEDISWHEDVIVYSVWDEPAKGGEFCGYLYLDLFPRDNKYGHYANFGIEPGFLTVDGKRSYPSTSLVCNFSKPTATKPSLLKHHEVVTFFHELGHGIHDLAGRSRFSYTHGTATVADFVEAPSQMLENWCWTPSVLKSLSKHWETGESIPDELVEKLVKTKHLNSAIGALSQLVIGTFDMTVHGPKSNEEAKTTHYGKLWNQLRHDISGIKGPEDAGENMEWGNRYATIGHFLGGYDAGYYGYLYSEVFSLDMFHSFFKKNPMDGKEGRRYRSTVLERGGSIEEMEFLKEFLGREPSTEAFYEELGIAVK